jgi:hypothetical protein
MKPLNPRKNPRSARGAVQQTPKKTPAELDQDIANVLTERRQPQLAALFTDPQTRKTFTQELRREIQKQQLARINETARESRPFSVKRLEQIGDRQVRSLVGNYATEAQAREKADQLDGWVETRDGRVVYGHAKEP